MADANTSTDRTKTWIFIIIVLLFAGLAVWLIINLTTPEKPVVEQPKPTPTKCEEVKPETPAELPKTGYDGE